MLHLNINVRHPITGHEDAFGHQAPNHRQLFENFNPICITTRSLWQVTRTWQIYTLILTFWQAIVWTLWSVALVTSIGRVILRHRIQGQFHADDYFALLGFIFLSALTAVVTVVTPIFEMERSYLLAAASNPLTPLPLPEAQFIAQTIKSLKLMFA